MVAKKTEKFINGTCKHENKTRLNTIQIWKQKIYYENLLN